MTEIDLSAPSEIHLIGAGGAGMNGIGAVLCEMGHRVTGSDIRESAGVTRLRALGVQVAIGHSPANVTASQLVARSTAIADDNEEVLEAKSIGATVLSRADILTAICKLKVTIAVAGTHGKTTTSSMLSLALVSAGLRPSFIIGGDLNEIGSGSVWDRTGELFVVEADESDGTFTQLGAHAVVITNIECDHLDYYGSMEAINDAFEDFASAAQGPKIICIDDVGAGLLAKKLEKCTTYGEHSESDYRIANVALSRYSSTFSIFKRGELLGHCELPVPGLHNVLNATAAVAAAVELGAKPEKIISALAKFAGVARRFEFRGERDGVTFVDDYAHLPTEVEAALAAAKAGDWKRVVAVFQPHRYSRTAELWNEFRHSFRDADHLVLTDVYAAGEEPQPGITSDLILQAVLAEYPSASVEYLPQRASLKTYLNKYLKSGDLCLTMGAGDLTLLPDEIQHRVG